jgi:hypothetical protein
MTSVLVTCKEKVANVKKENNNLYFRWCFIVNKLNKTVVLSSH